MKRILFLSFAYPFGHFGPSDFCTVRIMESLSRTEGFKVSNISCAPVDINDSKPNYQLLEGVEILELPFPEENYHHSYTFEHLLLLLKIPTYPLTHLYRIWKYYRACRQVIKNQHFDLVVAQCNPHWSVLSAVLLKKMGIINRLVVLFWDNIYGKIPRRVIPEWFALHRQRLLENWIARYADRIVSPTPMKSFHDCHGDVRAAKGKRLYLEHPSITHPIENNSSSIHSYFKEGMINIVYAGRLYDLDRLMYAIKLLDTIPLATSFNLILFFYNLPSESDINKMRHSFRGNIHISGRVPFSELLSLYSSVDVFLGFAGTTPAQVISKVYDYMCYGKPILYFFDNDNDINISAFLRYPLFKAVDCRNRIEDNKDRIEAFFKSCLGKTIAYEDVERLFPTATTEAYINLISKMVNS